MDGSTILVLYYMFVGRLDTTCARGSRARGGGMARNPNRPNPHTTASPRPFGGSPSRHTKRYAHMDTTCRGQDERSLTDVQRSHSRATHVRYQPVSLWPPKPSRLRRRPRGHNETRGFHAYASPPSATLLFPIFLSYSMPVTLMVDVNTKKPKMPHAIVITDWVCRSFFSRASVELLAATTAIRTKQSSKRTLLPIPARGGHTPLELRTRETVLTPRFDPQGFERAWRGSRAAE